MAVDLKDYIATIPNYPIEGVMFRDVTPILQHGEAFREAVDQLAAIGKELKADLICGPESRGFIFGMPLAYNLHKPFVLVRKAGKLPCEVVQKEYSLEYGTATIEMHKDSIQPGQRVVIVDDLIATGGTIKAAAELVESLGGEVVKILFLLELKGLEGRKLLEGYDVETVVSYDGK